MGYARKHAVATCPTPRLFSLCLHVQHHVISNQITKRCSPMQIVVMSPTALNASANWLRFANLIPAIAKATPWPPFIVPGLEYIKTQMLRQGCAAIIGARVLQEPLDLCD